MPFDDFGYTRVRASSLGVFLRNGHTEGTMPSVAGTWEYRDGVFAVSHPRPRTFLEVLTRQPGSPELVNYPVTLLAPAAAPHKPRRWVGCPRSERKCSALYLKAQAERLACRRCLGLVYSTQRATRSARSLACLLRTGFYSGRR